MENIIEVNNVKRYYKIAKRKEGMENALKHLFHREYVVKKAVDDISFTIQKGEIVGFIGPNGAENPPPSKCCQVFCILMVGVS